MKLTAEELAASTTNWLPWLKCPLLRLAAAKGYRSHPDQSDAKEARWGRYVAAVKALGFPDELAERFRRGPTYPNAALVCLKAQWKLQCETEASAIRQQAAAAARQKQIDRFFSTPLAAMFPHKPTPNKHGCLVWRGCLTGKGHAPRIPAGGGLSSGLRARSKSTRRRRALEALNLVETQEWRDQGARGTSCRAWTYAWTANIPLQELETAAALLAL